MLPDKFQLGCIIWNRNELVICDLTGSASENFVDVLQIWMDL